MRSPRGGRERGSSVPIMDAEKAKGRPFSGSTHCGCKVWHKEANLCMAQCPEVELPPEALMG